MPLLAFDTISQAAQSLFHVWSNNADYGWFQDNFNRFDWYYEDDLKLEKLKLKLCAIANLYYEFCHEAYDIYFSIPDEIIDDFATAGFPFSPFRLGQLSGKEYLNELKGDNDTFSDHQDCLLRSAVIHLASNMRYSIFEELYTSKNFTPDSLFDSFKQIANSVPDQKGLVYLMGAGDTFSNYS